MRKEYIKGSKIRKELSKLIKERISNGEDRQSIYDDLCERYNGPSDVAKLISNVPSQDVIINMKTINSFLFFFICAWSLLMLIGKLLLYIPLILNTFWVLIVFPLVFLWPVIGVWIGLKIKRYNGSYYRIIGLLSISAFLHTLQGFEKGFPENLIDLIYLVILLFLLACISIVSFYIGKKYFSHLGWTGPKTKNGKYILGSE